MNNLDLNLQQIKDQTIENMHLVRSQLVKAKTAMLKLDQGTAQEVMHYENRVNAAELSIDKDCEQVLALFHPLAIDLRFVLASLKINTHLERIGDHAFGIAKSVTKMDEKISDELFEKLRFNEMFDTCISMLDDAIHGWNFEDAKLARWIFGKDATINEINKAANNVLVEFATKGGQDFEQLLLLFSTMRKLERVGDLTKNIGEETIFFLEAKVLKHKDKT